MNRPSPAVVFCALALGLSAILFAFSRDVKRTIAPASVAQAADASTITQTIEVVFRPLSGGATYTREVSFPVDSTRVSQVRMAWTGEKFSVKTANGRSVFDYSPGVTRQSSKPQKINVEIENSVIEQTSGSQSNVTLRHSQTVTVQRGKPAANLFGD